MNDDAFGKESKYEWITLSCDKPESPVAMIPDNLDSKSTTNPNRPSDSWFDTMIKRKFESEREIETYFIIPLLDQLGYQENDIYIGCPVTMYEGIKAIKKEADVVTFHGESRDRKDSLLVIEAKIAGKMNSEGIVGQARSYAINLTTPFYLITNAVEIHVYQNLNGQYPDTALMKFCLAQLRESWDALYQRVNKTAVIEHKAKLDPRCGMIPAI